MQAFLRSQLSDLLLGLLMILDHPRAELFDCSSCAFRMANCPRSISCCWLSADVCKNEAVVSGTDSLTSKVQGDEKIMAQVPARTAGMSMSDLLVIVDRKLNISCVA